MPSASSQNKPNAGDLAHFEARDRDCCILKRSEQVAGENKHIEQDIKDLERKILEIGGSKLLTQKSKVDGIRVHIGHEITKAEVAKNKAEKDATKLQGTLATDTTVGGIERGNVTTRRAIRGVGE